MFKFGLIRHSVLRAYSHAAVGSGSSGGEAVGEAQVPLATGVYARISNDVTVGISIARTTTVE